jgi:hypothetical protein
MIEKILRIAGPLAPATDDADGDLLRRSPARGGATRYHIRHCERSAAGDEEPPPGKRRINFFTGH